MANEVTDENNDNALSVYCLNTQTSSPQIELILDTGCTRHMSPVSSYLSPSSHSSTSVVVSTADGGKLNSTLQGDIPFVIEGDSFNITKVLHVPGLKHNILSIASMNEKGFDVNFVTE